jgi:hypothetical protein
MALYIPHSIFHLAWLLYVRPETFEPYYVYVTCSWKPKYVLEFIEIWGNAKPFQKRLWTLATLIVHYVYFYLYDKHD